MSNDKQPEIRFPGFAEDWKQRKLIEGVSKIGDGLHGTPSYSEDGDVFFINGNNLVNGKISITKETKFVNESDQSKDDKSLNVNTILMSINGTIGNLAWYNNEKVMLGKSIAYLTVSDFDKNFVYFYLQTPMMRKYFISNLTGTTIKNLGLKTIRNTELFVADLDEQQKIGSFFKQLDDTIALHQRKLDLLKETKKGFLQKMFPKNGAKVPEIRFPGFTEDWEERKLNEGMTEYTDRVYIQDDEIYKQVSVKNVGEITLRGEQIGSKIGRKRQAKVNLIEHPDTLIFTRQTIEQGGIGFAPKETDGAIVTENMPTIDVDNDIINCNYLLAYVKTEDWYRKVILKNIEGGTAQIAIHEDSILSSEVLIPKIEEQQKIGAFFKQLDDTITLHQRKLDLLKETKKGFLQKMFV
ncbi:restriction endonuclease subunit S [Enterococcus faecium]|uniref:restriction endonuclease subunit S n=1 Tax=Enterococcus faecium TaxID=1352 RepID=UPI001F539D7A|nr:restriction endonuclease subunit S [Enterococcus faecium]MCI1181283.1 restriction endonuclease subunit S [Enterococcus faecium]MCT9087169.1 restriction endonuclease subunit S [Enterococcus faecium]MCV3162298.1 restriction endonuclease subunit S [Enterococcus faecium]MCV3169965.1 restriction endonuclease subunit S [Enterococcus faecium]